MQSEVEEKDYYFNQLGGNNMKKYKPELSFKEQRYSVEMVEDERGHYVEAWELRAALKKLDSCKQTLRQIANLAKNAEERM